METGIILDLETTGVDPEKDQVVEVGIIEFLVRRDADGTLLSELATCYSGLEDPGRPLPQEIADLTGLTDEVLANRKIDWGMVRGLADRASVVIAHNASFDRSFIERRPEFEGSSLHWACSVKHINWQKHGFRTRALNYLAADHGFVNPFAHRALFDCATTFRLIAPYLDELIRRSYLREFLVSAVGAAFETKDLLRTRGYRWNAEARVWAKLILEDELEGERQFMRDEIYNGEPRHREEEIRG